MHIELHGYLKPHSSISLAAAELGVGPDIDRMVTMMIL